MFFWTVVQLTKRRRIELYLTKKLLNDDAMSSTGKFYRQPGKKFVLNTIQGLYFSDASIGCIWELWDICLC